MGRYGAMDYIDLASYKEQSRALINTVMNVQIPQNFEKFLSSCTTGGFRRAQLYGVGCSVGCRSVGRLFAWLVWFGLLVWFVWLIWLVWFGWLAG
jgi:hypothetical protein